MITIAVLPGDGIGPEVITAAVAVFDAACHASNTAITRRDYAFGGSAIDLYGTPLPDETLAACRRADAVLLGAVGGPKWNDPNSAIRPEQGLLQLRKELDLCINLRPVLLYPELVNASPLRAERLARVDMLIVRELTGGLYFGRPQGIAGDGMSAVDTMAYTADEIERVLRVGFDMARQRRSKLTSVDKANVLATSQLWRRIASNIAGDYPDVTLDHALVDSIAMRLVTDPGAFDVIVTENTFGDILSDEASVLAGSLGLLPSASLTVMSNTAATRQGVYEPIHGSAPDIAGHNIANPIGAILSAAMMCRYSLDLDNVARSIEVAVATTIRDGYRTRDIEGTDDFLSTSEMAAAIIARL